MVKESNAANTTSKFPTSNPFDVAPSCPLVRDCQGSCCPKVPSTYIPPTTGHNSAVVATWHRIWGRRPTPARQSWPHPSRVRPNSHSVPRACSRCTGESAILRLPLAPAPLQPDQTGRASTCPTHITRPTVCRYRQPPPKTHFHLWQSWLQVSLQRPVTESAVCASSSTLSPIYTLPDTAPDGPVNSWPCRPPRALSLYLVERFHSSGSTHGSSPPPGRRRRCHRKPPRYDFSLWLQLLLRHFLRLLHLAAAHVIAPHPCVSPPAISACPPSTKLDRLAATVCDSCAVLPRRPLTSLPRYNTRAGFNLLLYTLLLLHCRCRATGSDSLRNAPQ